MPNEKCFGEKIEPCQQTDINQKSEKWRNDVIEKCEKVMSQWKKDPESWLEREGYAYKLNRGNEVTEKENKYRVTYIAIVSGFCEILCHFIGDEAEKYKLKEAVTNLSAEVREIGNKRLPVSEEVVDKTDFLAEAVISKIRIKVGKEYKN